MILYLCHPVAPLPEEIEARLPPPEHRDGPDWCNILERRQEARFIVRRNIDNALAWLRFLVVHTPWTIAAPWIPYVLALDDTLPEERRLGMEASRIMATRCAGSILTGGRISGGMEVDSTSAGGPTLDLTDLGYSPPTSPPSKGGWSLALHERWSALKPSAPWRSPFFPRG